MQLADKNTIRIALAQCNPLVGAIDKNIEMIKAVTERCCHDYQADIIVFPELTLTAYPPEDLLYREGFVDSAELALDELNEYSHKARLIIGLPIKRGEQLFNAACYFWQGKKQFYKKRELPNYGVFDEKRYFTADHESLLIDCKGRDIGLTICEDIWLPEAMRQATSLGAQAVININASPYHTQKHALRIQTLQQRIDENPVPIFYVNQVGGQDELVFDGHSLVIDAEKQLVAEAPAFDESLMLVDWLTDNSIQSLLPMRQETDPLAQIYQALVLGVKDYVNKNGFDGVVIGLSGGIDSALTLAIAADALGGENVEAVMMPSEYTSQISLDDAAEIAQNFAVNYEVISIKPMRDAFTQSLAPLFAGLPADTTEENIQARIRGVLLMAVSNKKRRLVLATGNKSEMAVGYATLYGDMCGGFAPLKDVSKILVYQLSTWRNEFAQSQQSTQVIPERIITRPPSAELKPDQTDQDSLPPYEVLDVILEKYLEDNMSVSSIVADGFDLETVQDVIRRVDLNEYKRRQAAPGVKITKQAFGRERRYPITSGYRAYVTNQSG